MTDPIARRIASAIAAFALGSIASVNVSAEADEPEHPRATFETSHGSFVLELDRGLAPETVENFLIYVRDGFYEGTLFHRVIAGFMVQGGGFTPDFGQPRTPGAHPQRGGSRRQERPRNDRHGPDLGSALRHRPVLSSTSSTTIS